MKRWTLWAILAIGAVLVIAPLAIGMIGKANDGATMMTNFKPIMQPAAVNTTADYYNNVFTKLRPVALAVTPASVAKLSGYMKGFQGVQADSKKLVPTLAAQLHMTPAQVQRFLATQFPSMSKMLANLPAMQRDFGGVLGLMSANTGTFKRVPAGLDWYKPLVTTMQGNVNNYQQANLLPSFSLLPWFFIVPGILLMLLAGYGLLGSRRVEVPFHRHLAKSA